MVNYNDSSRTLSGIDERSVVSLSLPSSVAAISIGGNVGTRGQVIAKNNITNKLEWDEVDDITIPDHSIRGEKLALDIAFTTSGNITLNNGNNPPNATLTANILRYVGELTGSGNVNLFNIPTGNRWFAFDYQTNNFTITNNANFIVGNLKITNNLVGALEKFVELDDTGDLTLTGNVDCAGILKSTKATPLTTEYGLDITGNAKIGGNLTVVGDIDLDDIITDELTVKGKALFQTDPAVQTTRKTEIDSSTGAIKQYSTYNPPAQITEVLNILNGEIECKSLIIDGTITQQTIGPLTTELQIANGIIDMIQIKQTNQKAPNGDYQIELRGAAKFEKLLGNGVDTNVAVFCDGDLLVTGNIVNQAGSIHTVVGEFRVVNAVTGNIFNRFRVQPLRDNNANPPVIPTVNFLADEIRFNIENNNPNVANPLMLFMDADVNNVPRLLTEGGLTILKSLDIGSADFTKANSFFEVDDINGEITLQSTTDLFNNNKTTIQKLTHQYVNSEGNANLPPKGQLELNARLVVNGLIDSKPNTHPPNLDNWNEINGKELRLDHDITTINTGTYSQTATTTINGVSYVNNNTTVNFTPTPPLANPNTPTTFAVISGFTNISSYDQMNIKAFLTSDISILDANDVVIMKFYPNLLVPTIVNPPPTIKGLTENLHTFMNSGCNWSKNGQGGDGHYVGFGNRNAGNPDANPTVYRKEDFDITIQNTGDVNGTGGILFNKPEPRIIGEANSKTKCLNLDLSDPSNILFQQQVRPNESLGIFNPTSEYAFPCDRLNIPRAEWELQVYGFLSLSDNFFTEIPPFLHAGENPRFQIGFSVYQENRKSSSGGEPTGNLDMFANIFYTRSTDNPPYDTSNMRHLTIDDPNRFFISGGQGINGSAPLYGGNGTGIWWEQTFTLDAVEELQGGETIRVYPCMSNNVPYANQEPAFVDLRSGRNLPNGSGDRQEWLVWCKPLPTFVSEYKGDGGILAGGYVGGELPEGELP